MRLKNLFSIRGRIGRPEYLRTGLILTLVLCVGTVANLWALRQAWYTGHPLLGFGVVLAGLFWPWLSMGLRRTHDIGYRSAWLLWRLSLSATAGAYLVLLGLRALQVEPLEVSPMAGVSALLVLVLGAQVSWTLARKPTQLGPNAHGEPHSGSAFHASAGDLRLDSPRPFAR